MVHKVKWIILYVFVLGLLVFTREPALADKPPWAGEDWNPANPPEAPEPIALTLIGMGMSGAAGYYLGKRKMRRSKRGFIREEELRVLNSEDKSPEESI